MTLAPAPAVALQATSTPAATENGRDGKADKADTSEKKKTSSQDNEKKPDKAKKAKKGKKAKKAKSNGASNGDGESDAAESGEIHRLSWKQHPSLRYGNVFRLDAEAKFQEDGRSSYPGGLTHAGLEPFELHRNRVGISGYLFKKVEYEVERELTEKELSEKDIAAGVAPKNQWRDVNVNLTFIKNAQLQVGRFKIPFGLDTLTGIAHNDFVYRTLGANYLTPSRDTGAMVHGRFFKHGLNYWVGAFQHDGDNARSKKIQGGDETVAARLTGTPLRPLSERAFGGLEIGSAFANSRLTDDSFRPNGLRGRTLLTQDTFFEPVYVKGRRYRWEAEADWTFGPGSARAEYTVVLDNRRGQGLHGEDLTDARSRSWYVSGTWLLSGETKKRPVKPAGDFLMGGWGAVEVVARIERLWFDSVGSGQGYRSPRAEFLLPEGEKAFTAGVNWTLNRFIKLQVNGIRESVEQRDRNPVLGERFPKAAFWNGVARLQLVL